MSRQVNLANGMILIVLTRSAIMAFASTADPSFTSGLSGVFFGGISALIGLLMILRAQPRALRLAPSH